MISRASVGAAIVTFHPDAGLVARVRAIAAETNALIVVDNTPGPEAPDGLVETCAAHGAELMRDGVNHGLGAALNQAFAQFAQRGFAAVVAFDQDSTPDAGLVDALLAAANADERCAVVGANWRDEAWPDVAARQLRRNRHVPFLFERVSPTHDLQDVTCVITSGSLFKISAWHEVGGFDAGLFLDLVDTDYCLRVRRHGYRIAVAVGATLQHRRGNKRPVALLGSTWRPAFMPPLRLRYAARNRVHVMARHGWQAPHWVVFELTSALKIGAEIAMLEDQKLAKLAACVRGTWDGLRGRLGRLESP